MIVEGILSRDLPLLQMYLRQRFHRSTSLAHVVDVGLEETVARLSRRDMEHARRLLRHMVRDGEMLWEKLERKGVMGRGKEE